MRNVLSISHRLGKRSCKWFSILAVVLLVLSMLGIFVGEININIDYDFGSDGVERILNPYAAAVLAAAVLVPFWYLLSFIICLPFVAIALGFKRIWGKQTVEGI